MKANLILDNVKAYNIEKFDIKLNEICKVELVENSQPVRWFADSDQVLSIEVSGNEAIIKATNVGVCEIQLQSNDTTVKKLFIEVYDQITTSLNISFDSPKLK